MNSSIFENLLPLAPEIYLCLSAFVLLIFGVYRQPRVTGELVMAVVLMLALTMLLLPAAGAKPFVVMNGMFVSDGFTAFVKLLILAGTILVLLFSYAWLQEEGGRPFEFLLLVLMSVLGMMCMVSANDLLAVYLGLELTSLALYVLAAFERDSTRSTEAGLKYFVLGALASGMMLFGISLVYGFTGTIDFGALAAHLGGFADEAAGNATVPRAVVVGLVFIIIGFCFKASAVPFHMWTPDVYEGAPTPVTAFFAVAPKIAALALFTRVLMQPFADMIDQWQQIVVLVSLASMLLGALAALRQTNIKRLLAYSSIGHAGFMLMGLASGTSTGAQGMLIYLAVYLFASAGAFGCVLLMKRDGEYVETIADLSGLSRTHPLVALSLAAFMFSMAGIPPLAGFFGKLYVVLPAIEAGLAPLAVMGLIASVIACYYYLRVIKFMYFDEPGQPFDAPTPFAMRVALAVCAIFTVFFCLVPGPLVSKARAAASLLLH